jgi:DNA-directed RNA polymerase subunit RPC12/RpoP
MGNCAKCGKKFGFLDLQHEWKTKAVHPEWRGQSLHYECLVQEWSNVPKLCLNCGYYELTETVEDEDIGSYSKSKCRKFSIALDIAGDERFTQLVAMANGCSSYINKNEYQEKCLKGEIGKEKEFIQIVLDFSSLKDVMSKGGLVMTTYKCPNCNGMVNIPEAGKILMCQYCGTPIKPVDIFEKIKSLIQ